MAGRRPAGKTYCLEGVGLARDGARQMAEDEARRSGRCGGDGPFSVSLWPALGLRGQWYTAETRSPRVERRTRWWGCRTARCEMQRTSSSNSSSKKIVDWEVSRYVVCAPVLAAWGAFGLERLRSETRAFFVQAVLIRGFFGRVAP